MNKLLVALFAGAFAFGSAPALADDSDKKPLSKMDLTEAKAATAEATATWAKMTGAQKAVAERKAAARGECDRTALDVIARWESSPKYSGKTGAIPPIMCRPQPAPLRGDPGFVKEDPNLVWEHWRGGCEKMTPEERTAAKEEEWFCARRR